MNDLLVITLLFGSCFLVLVPAFLVAWLMDACGPEEER